MRASWFLRAVVAGVTLAAASARAEATRCVGLVGGVESESTIQFQRTPHTTYVAGAIENQFASYLFNGEMFGGTEGYVSLVDQRSGARVDRVYIALTESGFMVRAERSAPQYFDCR
jgi:hypothetical protein